MAKKGRVDLVLVHPGGRKGVYQRLGSQLAAVEPPIWAGMMATFVRKRGYRAMILDANAEGLPPTEVAERIGEIGPLLTVVVAYGQNPCASTMSMPAVGAICKEIKRISQELKILLVGGHVAALPERTLREEEADFVCDGEGPYTIVALLEELKSRHPRFDRVPSLLFWAERRIVQTRPAPLVMDLDSEMPGVAWDMLPMDKYRAHNWHCFTHIHERRPYASLYTTLGCPFHCDFCCIQAPFRRGESVSGYGSNRNSYRRWSPEAVVAQIDLLVEKYGVRNFKFADEIFVLNNRHVIGICNLIIERRYDLNIWAYARVDSWNDKVLECMKKAGFNWLCFGIESASPRVRHEVHKGYKQEQLFRAIEAVRKYGFYVIGNYLFGLPEEDRESMEQTLGLAKDLNCEFANFYCAMAYPGSNLYERVVKENLPLPESWTGYSQHAYDALPLPTKYLSGIDVLEFRDKAFQEYFTNPRYLDMIRRTFGLHIVEHIREMTGQKVERKYSAPISHTRGSLHG